MSLPLDDFDPDTDVDVETLLSPSSGIQTAGSFGTAPSPSTVPAQSAPQPSVGGLNLTPEQFEMWLAFQRQLNPVPIVTPTVLPP
jgi:hypothetical protein